MADIPAAIPEALGETASPSGVLFDAFCHSGGAAKGYQRAGFYVVGCDIEPRPDYCGDEFIQADALELLSRS